MKLSCGFAFADKLNVLFTKIHLLELMKVSGNRNTKKIVKIFLKLVIFTSKTKVLK